MSDELGLGKLENISFEEIVEKLRKDREELLAKAKPMKGLIFSEYFLVGDVSVSYHAHNVLSLSDMRFDGEGYQGHNAGYSSRSVLEVSPENDSLPIRKLEFLGDTGVQPGMRLLATIPRYKKETLGRSFSERLAGPGIGPEESILIDREYKEIESAIALFFNLGNGIRREFAANYSEFIR